MDIGQRLHLLNTIWGYINNSIVFSLASQFSWPAEYSDSDVPSYGLIIIDFKRQTAHCRYLLLFCLVADIPFVIFFSFSIATKEKKRRQNDIENRYV